ncbi:MAG: hypothetical protein NTX03_09115 [Bacteroidetes bacterium]|nr:hypothetical protein [Bacteroidota bacterium]
MKSSLIIALILSTIFFNVCNGQIAKGSNIIGLDLQYGNSINSGLSPIYSYTTSNQYAALIPTYQLFLSNSIALNFGIGYKRMRSDQDINFTSFSSFSTVTNHFIFQGGFTLNKSITEKLYLQTSFRTDYILGNEFSKAAYSNNVYPNWERRATLQTLKFSIVPCLIYCINARLGVSAKYSPISFEINEWKYQGFPIHTTNLNLSLNNSSLFFGMQYNLTKRL